MLHNIYTTLIQPHLDYACVIYTMPVLFAIGRYKDTGKSSKKCLFYHLDICLYSQIAQKCV